MIEELIFDKDDVIAVIAPHPDDECLGAFAALHLMPDHTVFIRIPISAAGRGTEFHHSAEIPGSLCRRS